MLNLKIKQGDKILTNNIRSNGLKNIYESSVLEPIKAVNQKQNITQINATSKKVQFFLAQISCLSKASKCACAKDLHISVRTLTRNLSKDGLTYSYMLNQERFKRLKTLLCKDIKTDELAIHLGLSNQPYFYSWFKQHYNFRYTDFKEHYLLGLRGPKKLREIGLNEIMLSNLGAIR
jgi:AraC-like DNA-binding protein